MQRILFVHGTGVRHLSYAQTLRVIQEKLRDQAEVFPGYWGDLGSSLQAGGRSIPTYDATRRIADPLAESLDHEADQDQLWQALLNDPLLELRGWATLQPQSTRPPWQQTRGAQLIQIATDPQILVPLEPLLLQGGVTLADVARGQRAVCASKAFHDALADADEDLADHRAAIARAWIAATVRQVQAATLEDTGEWIWPALLLDGALRSQVEHRLREALGGGERGLGGGLLKRLAWPVAQGWLTREGLRRRGAISDAASPAAGDILMYQARGEAIRARVREQILAAGGPVHVLAHSLGGVACVELLAAETLPVRHLITVGSQAPFLYEINALRSLPFGSPLPASLPAWLNIYDPRDFLSYVGEGLFPGRVVDRCVDNRQAFPASHSAYWWNPEVWAAIHSILSL